MEKDYQYAEEAQEFGVTIDSPSLYFITVIDLNNKEIKVGYQKPQVTIEELINQYLIVTSCKYFFINKICFRIIQAGEFENELAVESSKLSSYGLNFDQACFRVCDSVNFDMNKELGRTISKIYQVYQRIDAIHAKIRIQGQQYDFTIEMDETLLNLKKRLVKWIDILKEEIPSNIQLIVNGVPISDDQVLMMDYRVTSNSIIHLIVKINEGCLASNSIVSTQEGEKLISELKVGDQITSFNHKTKAFERDYVTFVLKSTINQCIQITFDKGTSIMTTSNHFFLCEDNKYRKVDQKANSMMRLKTGCRLRGLDNKIAEVIDIKYKKLQRPQTFYHISVQNNHNFVCNQLIHHNMFVNIIMPDQSVEAISLSPNQSFFVAKQKIEQIYCILAHNQRLQYLGKELANHQTMVDSNISKQSKIYFQFKSAQQFNFLHSKTPILTQDGRMVPIAEIKEGQYIATYDSHNKPNSKGDVVVSILKQRISSKMVVNLDSYDEEIVMSADCFLELQSGQVMNIMDLCYKFERGSWPKLRKVDGSTYKIKEIAHQNIKPTFYYKLILSGQSNYIAKNIIIHNQILNVRTQGRRITLGAISSDSILTIKERLSPFINIAVNKIKLEFQGQVLSNQQTLAFYNIRSWNIVVANQIQPSKISKSYISQIQPKYRKIQQLYLQISQSEKIKILYANYKDKSVEQIMQEIVPNYKSSYFFLFLNIFILPYELLNKIESTENKFGQNLVIVVKNEKLAFIQNTSIKPEQIVNNSRIQKRASQKQMAQSLTTSRIQVHRDEKLSLQFQKAAERISDDQSIKIVEFKAEKFFLPFLYFTSKQYNERISQRMKNFHLYKNELSQNDSTYSIIKDLYINMNKLENYYGLCYFGMKNFKCSRFFKPKHTFYWHSFIIGHLQEKRIIQEISSQKGTLFVINSINGKNISQFSLHPAKQQILFAPFTYFMIEKIENQGQYEVVWLSEVSSPVTFMKNIVLWVDDQPYNNTKQIKNIQAKHDIQILQVTSTVLAEKWIKQFGWLLKWKGIQFKLISDMTRVEDGVWNNDAGVDLLERLYKDYGFTAKTLIYCGDEANAQAKINSRQIPKEKFRYFSIAVKHNQVLQFCSMDDEEEPI